MGSGREGSAEPAPKDTYNGKDKEQGQGLGTHKRTIEEIFAPQPSTETGPLIKSHSVRLGTSSNNDDDSPGLKRTATCRGGDQLPSSSNNQATTSGSDPETTMSPPVGADVQNEIISPPRDIDPPGQIDQPEQDSSEQPIPPSYDVLELHSQWEDTVETFIVSYPFAAYEKRDDIMREYVNLYRDYVLPAEEQEWHNRVEEQIHDGYLEARLVEPLTLSETPRKRHLQPVQPARATRRPKRPTNKPNNSTTTQPIMQYVEKTSASGRRIQPRQVYEG